MDETTPIVELAEKIKGTMTSDLTPSRKITTDLFSSMSTSPNKPRFESYTPYTEDSVYKTLSSGEKIGMYDNYIAGTNNNERLAQSQTTGEKWSNGVTKALAKTGSAVVGGTIGLVYGLGEALTGGSLYDNDFSNKLADLDTKLSYQLPNYYTQQEQDKNLVGQIGTANFWADKFLGGLSFTAGAIVSEAIWAYATGGTSLATMGARRVARWGVEAIGETAALSGMSKYKTILKNFGSETIKTGVTNVGLVNTVGKVGEVTSIVGRLARSAGYEASVEALQFKKEAKENFYNNFQGLNGREPNTEDIQKFNDELDSTANGVFAANMAILMPSNLITLGHVLDIKSPIKLGINEFINKKAFGYGVEKLADGSFKALKATTKQKIARNIFDYAVKPGLTEGVFEEGLQGVSTKVGNRWMEHTYDPKNSSETFSNMDALSKSIAEQYGTKEGLVDVGLGVLIGMFGGAANVRGEQKQKQIEQEFKETVSNTLGTTDFLIKNVINTRVQSANRVEGFSKEAKEEAEIGNIVKSTQAKNSAMLSFINARMVLGDSAKDITSEMKTSLDNLTVEQWVEAGVEQENIEEEKETRLKDFNELTNSWKQNKTYWQYMVGQKLQGEQNLEATGLEKSLGGQFSKNASIVEALAWQSTIGENAHTMMRDAQSKIAEELGVEKATTLRIIEDLKVASQSNTTNLNNLQKEHSASTQERDMLVKRVQRLNRAPKEGEGNKRQGDELRQAEERLLEVEANISNIENEANSLADTINSTNSISQNLDNLSVEQNITGNTITGANLLALNENIKSFEKSAEYLKNTNPQRAQYLQDIMKEYQDASDIFLAHRATQKVITSPDFKMENVEGFLKRKLTSKKAMNENTQEWLQEALNKYADSQAEVISSELDQSAVVVQEEVVADKTSTKPKSEEQINSEEIEKIEEQRQQALLEELNKDPKEYISKLALDNYIFSHVTNEDAAKTIVENGMNISLGTGISSTISFGADNTINQIQKLERGEVVHQDSLNNNIVIFSVPKNILDGAQGVSIQDKFEEYLIENNLLTENGELAIPNEFQVANYNNGVLTENGFESKVEKINEKFDKKITEKQPAKTIEQYKKVVEDLLTNVYRGLNYLPKTAEELISNKPTQEDINKYRELKEAKSNTNDFKALRQKLSDWKVLASVIDDEYTSIAEILDLIQQLETQEQQEGTKDEITEDEAKTDLRGTGEKQSDKRLLQNQLGNVTVHSVKDSDKYTFSHTTPTYFVDQLGGDYTITRGTEQVDVALTDLKSGDVLTAGGMNITVRAGGVLEVKIEDFNSRQQALNMYVNPARTGSWTYLDVYTVKGDERVKMASQFTENIQPEKIYNQQVGDTLTLHVDNKDGWNTSKGDSKELFKIYFKDSEGNNLSVAKAGSLDKSGVVDTKFELMRELAYDRWVSAGKPDNMDLGISVKIDNIFFGSAELIMDDKGSVINVPILEEEVKNVIIAKGYIENGKVVLDTEIKDTNTTFVGKLSKNNPNLKVPIIIFKKGVHNVAFPITMAKTNTPVNFDAILESGKEPQQVILDINQAIITNGIKTPKLIYSDINREDILQITREAFENKKSFVSAEVLATNTYNKSNLVNDATINIDLSNLDNAISSPKIRVDLEGSDFNPTIDELEEYSLNTAEKVSKLVDEIDILIRRAPEGILETFNGKEDINSFVTIIEEGVNKTREGEVPQTGANAYDRNINVLRKALEEGTLTNKAKKYFGKEIMEKAKKAVKHYDNIRNQIKAEKESLKSGEKNSDCI